TTSWPDQDDVLGDRASVPSSSKRAKMLCLWPKISKRTSDRGRVVCSAQAKRPTCARHGALSGWSLSSRAGQRVQSGVIVQRRIRSFRGPDGEEYLNGRGGGAISYIADDHPVLEQFAHMFRAGSTAPTKPAVLTEERSRLTAYKNNRSTKPHLGPPRSLPLPDVAQLARLSKQPSSHVVRIDESAMADLHRGLLVAMGQELETGGLLIGPRPQ